MPNSKRVPDGFPRGIRPEVPEGIAAANIVPGSQVPGDAGFAPPSREDVAAGLQSVSAGVHVLATKLTEAGKAALSELHTGTIPIISKLRSAPGESLDRASAFRGRINDKIKAEIAGRLGQAMEFTSRLGLTPPGPDEAAYATNTGDVVGAFIPLDADKDATVVGTLNQLTSPLPVSSDRFAPTTDDPGAPSDPAQSPPYNPDVGDAPGKAGGTADGQPTSKPFAPELRCGDFHLIPEDQFRPQPPSAMFPFNYCYTASTQATPHLQLIYPHTYNGFTISCGFVETNDSDDVPPAGWRKWCGKLTGKIGDPPHSGVWAPPGWYPVFFTDGTYWFTNQPGLEQYGQCWQDCTDKGGIPPGGTITNKPIPPQQPCIPICQPQCPPCDDPGKPDDPNDPDQCFNPANVLLCPIDEDKRKPPAMPDKDEYCEKIQAYVENEVGDNLPSVSTYLGFRPAKTKAGGAIQRAVCAAFGFSQQIFPELTERLAKWLHRMNEDFTKGLACDRGKMVPLSALGALVKVIQRYVPVIPIQTERSLDQASNYVCQSLIPSVDEADAMYLKGEIDIDTWECYVKANGSYVGPAKKSMRAKRHRPNSEQYILLFRRGIIKEDELKKLLKTTGVLDDQDREDLLKVTEHWPTQTDANRYMLRDVADTENVDWKEVDKQFDAKYKGRVKQYLEALGIPREVSLDHWRAHFHLPSYTMATEMFHRLRKGEVDEKLVMTEDKLKALLIQDDWHPDWIARMIEIAYKPVTRTDAIRAYYVHSIDDDQFKKFFLDWGYNEKSADFYVKYHYRYREIQDRRRAGFPTLRTLVNQYARCELTESQYRETIGKLVVSPEQEKAALEAAFLARSVTERKMSIQSVRRPFVLGLIDENAATAMLAERKIDSECVPSLLELWKAQAMRRDKFVSASQLCKMRERSIIGAEEQILALRRSGWSLEDAIRIAQLCASEIGERSMRKMEAAARRQQADARRAAREAEKARRLAECGPPDCPKNTPGGRDASEDRQPNTVSP